MDLDLRRNSFYEKRDTEIGFAVTCLSTNVRVVSYAVPAGNVSWMFFQGGTELKIQVNTGSWAGHTHSQ